MNLWDLNYYMPGYTSILAMANLGSFTCVSDFFPMLGKYSAITSANRLLFMLFVLAPVFSWKAVILKLFF